MAVVVGGGGGRSGPGHGGGCLGDCVVPCGARSCFMCGLAGHVLPDCPQATAACSDRSAQRTLANFFSLREVFFDDKVIADNDIRAEHQSDTPPDRSVNDKDVLETDADKPDFR
jgi:hypothetical protein